MLTYPDAPVVVRDDRPAYRPFRARLRRSVPLGPHFRLLTFAGPELHTLGTDGLDQRIKIVFPLADGHLDDLGVDDAAARAAGDWYRRWRALPAPRRNPFRTFTIRAVRPWARELDVVVVEHPGGGAAGPAARWLATARHGDEVLVIGPDARSVHSAVGIDFHPGDATRILLVGDETAAPAICAVLEALPPRRRAEALVEVPATGDVLPLDAGPHVDVAWLPRDGAPHGAPLERALRAWLAANPGLVRSARAPRPQDLPDVDVDTQLLWESPERGWGEELYAWLAGEAAVVRALRRCLVGEHGVDRRRVAFMGYWRHGRAEQQ